MKKIVMLFAGIMLLLVLSACGQKSQGDVVSSLNDKVEGMKGYKAQAKMTLQMGTDPQSYDVEIWHKNPDFYRVSLKNSAKEQSQMILRNDDGVFVLTPALNKSFKFQSEWPENSSQAYLYESLVKDIIEDKGAKFTSTDDHYVFETKTRYQNNKMLPYQEITINKKDLSPVSVKVMDADHNSLVTVEFSKVKFDAAFDKDAFDMQKNMTRAKLEVPVMNEVKDEAFAVKYPNEAKGASLTDEQEIKTENGKRVILTYEGDKSFTLIQEKAEVVETSLVATAVNGEPVDLGFTVGAATSNSVTWTYDGVNYTLASKDMEKEELLDIARTVDGTSEK
ncbi:outer membrane lipoprotein carrier protein LolA [Peribacillus loiseleuriae]|uniref:LolA family protein n=1 Tax=Peribacillus loiseleuriae TaxID=1679170 RepID=UPI00381518EA